MFRTNIVIKTKTKYLIYKNRNIMEKPNVAAKSPFVVDLKADQNYAWCACGRSANQPWCDGSHQGTAFSPNVFVAKENAHAALCGCKQTSNAPYCDGSHMNL